MKKMDSRAKLYGYSSGDQYQNQSPEKVFSDIEKQNLWTSDESVSGLGSTLEQTRKIRKHLPVLLREMGIGSFLDVPCGDFHWMQKVDLGGIQYTGGDLVESIVRTNQEKYASHNRQFLVLDLMKSDLGSHDLLFCRDCLVHLSFEHIQQVLQNLCKSDISYLMATTFPEEPANEDIITGGWRPLNLQLPPFSFPPPVSLLNEGCTEMEGTFADKSLGIWRVSDICHF